MIQSYLQIKYRTQKMSNLIVEVASPERENPGPHRSGPRDDLLLHVASEKAELQLHGRDWHHSMDLLCLLQGCLRNPHSPHHARIQNFLDNI